MPPLIICHTSCGVPINAVDALRMIDNIKIEASSPPITKNGLRLRLPSAERASKIGNIETVHGASIEMTPAINEKISNVTTLTPLL